jgi:outer membrane lipoprotein SlyB
MKRLNSCILAVSLLASAAWVQASEMHVLGGLIGGAIGAGVGKQIGGREGAVIGAAIGGLTGVAIADRQNETRVVEREVVEVREPRVIEREVIREEYRPAPRVVERVYVEPCPVEKRVVYVQRPVERVVHVREFERRDNRHDRHDRRDWNDRRRW